MSYINFQNVTFSYDQETSPEEHLIRNFNLEIEKGEFVAILGHNGCGKSTVAKLCNGIEVPLEGKVFVDGIDTSVEASVYDVRRRVGMVFQNPDNQIVCTIVEDDVAFGPENLGVEPDEIRKRVDNALKVVKMYDFRYSEPHKLSGGQKQRVAIAGIIAMEPECIVLDESTAMLDPQGRREVMETAKQLNKKGITIVFITHYMDEAVQADRIIVMEKGKIVMDDIPEKIFSDLDQLRKLHLDVPDVTKLAHNLRNKGMDVPENILNVREMADYIEKKVK